jgi:hypothetical protein
MIDIGGIREIDLYVVVGTSRPGTIIVEALAGTGYDAPTGAREAFDRRMADTAARARQDKYLAWFIV